MATPKISADDLKKLKKLVRCKMEVDLIEAEVKALKEDLISKEVFDHLMSLKSKVKKRYATLLMHVHKTLQERLKQYEQLFLAKPETDVTALAMQVVAEGVIERNVLDNITSLHSQVPLLIKTRYLLLAIQTAFQEKLDRLKSDLLIAPSELTDYKGMRLKLMQHVRLGVIRESVLNSHLSTFENNLTLKQGNLEILTEKLKYKKERLNLSCDKIQLSMCPFQSEAVAALGPQHLSKLSELLVSYAYKWKDIGVSLNFQPQDLQTIETTPLLIPGAPKSYLLRLLQDWLQMTLRHTLPPTVENLKKALSSQTVGLGALIFKFQPIVEENAHSYVLNQPYSSTKVSLDAKRPSVIPIRNEVYIEEGESTLLEVTVTRAGKADVAYKWNRNEISCGSQPILHLSNADIAWNSDKISCEVKARLAKLSPVVTVPITVHVSCPLDEFTPSLASMYLSRPEVPEDTWPPTGSTKYINLAIIKQQKINYSSEYARLTIRGDIDDVLQDKETIDYAKMYDSLERERQVMFIEGRPGSGKTTFVHKITHDWASSSCKGIIRILLLVSLRVLNTIKNSSLSSILQLFRDVKVTSEMIEKRNGKGVCFIFDGLDEFSPSDGKDSIVYKIIDRSYLHQSTVVVASRPAALAEIRNKGDSIIEVLGFTSSQIQEYFAHYPFSDATKPAKLKAYLSLHPNILHMCYLPIHATMVAFLFEVTGQVPKTETDMYALFTRFTLVRSISKNKKLERNAGDNVLQRLNEEEKCYFKQIRRLALEKTLSNKQVLDHEEINISLGLICIDRTADLYGFKDIYTFLHLTFQEYLAAYHISTLSDEEQMKLIEEHGHKNHMLVVWKFFCGLVEIKPLQNKFKTLLHKTQENTLYQFQCAYESQQQIVCAQLLKAVHYDIQLANKFLSTPDFTAIGYVTNKTILPVKLSLTNCDVDTVAIDALLSEMEDLSKQSLKSLHVEAKALNDELIVKLLTNFQDLKSLSLVKLSDNSSQQLSKSSDCEEFAVLTKLQSLTLRGFEGESAAFQMMLSALRQCENLTELNITHNKIGELAEAYLSQSLPHCKNLQRVDISKNGLSSDQVNHLLSSMKQLTVKYIKGLSTQGTFDAVSTGQLLQHLRQFSSIQLVDIQMTLEEKHVDLFMQMSRGWNHLKALTVVSEPWYLESVSTAVSNSLQLYFHNVEVLALKYFTCDLKGAQRLIPGLQRCPNLKVLDLSGNKIEKEQLHILLSLNFSRLEELYFDSSYIHDDEAALIASHLQNLEVLSLSLNKITNFGAKALAAQLHHCTKLVKLDLHGNLINDDAAGAIAASLRFCTNFQLLHLSEGNCRNFASTYKQAKKEDRKRLFGCDKIQFV